MLPPNSSTASSPPRRRSSSSVVAAPLTLLLSFLCSFQPPEVQLCCTSSCSCCIPSNWDPTSSCSKWPWWPCTAHRGPPCEWWSLPPPGSATYSLVCLNYIRFITYLFSFLYGPIVHLIVLICLPLLSLHLLCLPPFLLCLIESLPPLTLLRLLRQLLLNKLCSCQLSCQLLVLSHLPLLCLPPSSLCLFHRTPQLAWPRRARIVVVVVVLTLAHVVVLRKPMIPTCLYRPRGLSLNWGILSWSVLGHILSEEQSKDSSDDGRLTIVQCHHYHRPPSSDLYQSSIQILSLTITLFIQNFPTFYLIVLKYLTSAVFSFSLQRLKSIKKSIKIDGFLVGLMWPSVTNQSEGQTKWGLVIVVVAFDCKC